METNHKFSVKNIGCFFINVLFVILDIILLLLLLGCIVCIVLSLSNIIELLADFKNSTSNQCDNNSEITLWVEVLGIALTGVLIPVMAGAVSLYINDKSLAEQISDMLAKGANVRLYLIKIPLGLWYDLISQYYRNPESVPLSEYNYCLHLVFCGSVFQRFNLNVLEVCLPGRELNHKIWEQNNDKCIICDSTGVANFKPRKNVIGTNIAFIIDREKDELIEEALINLKEKNATVTFDLSFKRNEDPYSIRWEQFFKCIFPFPFIRGLYVLLIKSKTLYSYCRYKLNVNSYISTDDREVQFFYNIYDVEVEDKRAPIQKRRKNHKQANK